MHIVQFMRSINPETLAGSQNVALSALQQAAAYFAESDRSLRVIVTDAGRLHGKGFSLPQSVTLSVKSRSRWRETEVITARITAFPAYVVAHPRAAIYAPHAARGRGSHRPMWDRLDTRANRPPAVG